MKAAEKVAATERAAENSEISGGNDVEKVADGTDVSTPMDDCLQELREGLVGGVFEETVFGKSPVYLQPKAERRCVVLAHSSDRARKRQEERAPSSNLCPTITKLGTRRFPKAWYAKGQISCSCKEASQRRPEPYVCDDGIAARRTNQPTSQAMDEPTNGGPQREGRRGGGGPLMRDSFNRPYRILIQGASRREVLRRGGRKPPKWVNSLEPHRRGKLPETHCSSLEFVCCASPCLALNKQWQVTARALRYHVYIERSAVGEGAARSLGSNNKKPHNDTGEEKYPTGRLDN